MSVMSDDTDVSQLSHALMERALAYGARDNVTVISVAIHGPERASRDRAADDSHDDPVEEDPDTARNEQLPPI